MGKIGTILIVRAAPGFDGRDGGTAGRPLKGEIVNEGKANVNGMVVRPRNDIDRPLIVGAALFGVGWGLGGYCPGPAIAALGLGSTNPLLFIVAMVAGSLAYRVIHRPPQP